MSQYQIRVIPLSIARKRNLIIKFEIVITRDNGFNYDLTLLHGVYHFYKRRKKKTLTQRTDDINFFEARKPALKVLEFLFCQ